MERSPWCGEYHVDLQDIRPLFSGAYQYLAFRLGQAPSPELRPGHSLDFRVNLYDGGRTYSWQPPAGLLYPEPPVPAGAGDPYSPGSSPTPGPRLVFQTIRVPLAALVDKGFDLRRLRGIQLCFDVTGPGRLYLTDLHFTR